MNAILATAGLVLLPQIDPLQESHLCRNQETRALVWPQGAHSTDIEPVEPTTPENVCGRVSEKLCSHVGDQSMDCAETLPQSTPCNTAAPNTDSNTLVYQSQQHNDNVKEEEVD